MLTVLAIHKMKDMFIKSSCFPKKSDSRVLYINSIEIFKELDLEKLIFYHSIFRSFFCNYLMSIESLLSLS